MLWSCGSVLCTSCLVEVESGCSVGISDVSSLSKASLCGHVTVIDDIGYATKEVRES